MGERLMKEARMRMKEEKQMKNEKRRANTPQRGFTLIEFMVVAALIAMAVAFTIIQFGKGNVKRHVVQVMQELDELQEAVHETYDPVSGYIFTGSSTTTTTDISNAIYENGSLPEYMVLPPAGTNPASIQLSGLTTSVTFITASSAGPVTISFGAATTTATDQSFCAQLAVAIQRKYNTFSVSGTLINVYGGGAYSVGYYLKPANNLCAGTGSGTFSFVLP